MACPCRRLACTSAPLAGALLSALLAAAAPGRAVEAKAEGAEHTMQRELHGIQTRRATIHFGELSRREQSAPAARVKRRAVHHPLPVPRRAAPAEHVRTPSNHKAPARQAAARGRLGLAPDSPAVSANFLGLADDDTVIPPDTDGAVGPNHVVTMLNSQVVVQNRSGATVLAAVSLTSFWAAVGASSPFDPRVLYDPYQNRWVVTAADGAQSATSTVLVGASTGPDPTGTWNLFSIRADSTGALWADYPQSGFNKDWVVVSVNLFTVSSNTFNTSYAYAINKSALYSGSGATFTRLTDPNGGLAPAHTYDNNVAGLFVLQDFNGTQALVKLLEITGPVGSETLGPVATGSPFGPGFIQLPATWGQGPAADFLPQKGVANLIAADDTRIQSLSYRNSNLWMTQAIFLPTASPTHSSIQWAELSTAGAVVQSGRIDDASGAIFYDYPSLAVNRNGDVLIGYSTFSSTQFAGGSYSFRAAGDAAGTLQAAVVLKAGLGSYVKTFGFGSNRWGDFSGTVVDPLNDTDFWTLQEYADTPVLPASTDGNGRWGTWWGNVQPPRTVSHVSVSASPSTVAPGQPVTFTATVTGSTPTGTVQFQVNGVNVGAPVALVNGVATLTTTLSMTGSFSITAIYSGDGSNLIGTSSAFTETVSNAASVSTDIPALPAWGLVALAALLLVLLQRSGPLRR